MPLQGFPAIMTGGRLTAVTPSFSAGLNFRATAGFVTDVAPDTYCLASDAYPTSRGGYTFGWESTGVGFDSRDRNAGVDPELAGINFQPNGFETSVFRFNLPSAGSYDIRLALGDGNGANAQSNYMILKDDTTALITFSPLSTSSTQFGDAAGNVWTNTLWVANNVAVNKTFSSAILRIAIGDTGSDSSCLVHLGLVQTA